jgi:hypothetical protein
MEHLLSLQNEDHTNILCKFTGHPSGRGLDTPLRGIEHILENKVGHFTIPQSSAVQRRIKERTDAITHFDRRGLQKWQ